MSAWQISKRVAFVGSEPERVVALHLDRPAEPPLAFLGSAAAILRAFMADDDLQRPIIDDSALLESLASSFEIEPATILPEVQAFLAEYAGSGFLVQHPAAES